MKEVKCFELRKAIIYGLLRLKPRKDGRKSFAFSSVDDGEAVVFANEVKQSTTFYLKLLHVEHGKNVPRVTCV